MHPYLEAHIDKRGPDECWEWTGTRNQAGYGRLHLLSMEERAHRAVWADLYGPIPAGKIIRHTCDNPICCNPAHLRLGTNADNMADKVRKGRQAKGERNSHAKLREAQVLAIRRIYATGNISQREMARLTTLHRTTISDIVTGKRWRHLLLPPGASPGAPSGRSSPPRES